MSMDAVHPGVQAVDWPAINRAFSRQSSHFDQDDKANPILTGWRQRVYNHVKRYMKPNSHILELNSGTGIDALHFISQGHTIHCTDLADGMIELLKKKKQQLPESSAMTIRQCSFDSLDAETGPYDYIFSNFGGLNCIANLTRVTEQFPALIKSGGYVTWVIMPRVCFWEISWLFKGYFKLAFRRFRPGGALAHLEGEFFQTHYFSLKQVRKAFGKNYRMVRAEGLGVFSPPPSAHAFPIRRPGFYRFLSYVDSWLSALFPFNRWADHIIVTFQYTGSSK